MTTILGRVYEILQWRHIIHPAEFRRVTRQIFLPVALTAIIILGFWVNWRSAAGRTVDHTESVSAAPGALLSMWPKQALNSGNPNPGGGPRDHNTGDTLTAFQVTATNSFVGPTWVGPPGTHNTHIAMTDGSIFMSGSDPAQARMTGTWTPENQLSSANGTGIWGHLAILNLGIGPGIDVANSTGLNNPNAFNSGFDIANTSSDSDGEIWLTGGPSGASSSGIVQMVFGGTPWPSAPYCQLTLKDEGARWASGATVRVLQPLGGKTVLDSLTLEWNNNGVNMPNGFGGPGVGIMYFCVASP